MMEAEMRAYFILQNILRHSSINSNEAY